MLGFGDTETHNAAMMNPLMIGLLTIGTLLMCYFPYSQAKDFIARLFNSFFGSTETTPSKYGFFGGRKPSSTAKEPLGASDLGPLQCETLRTMQK